MTAVLVFVLVSIGLLLGKFVLILFPVLRRCFIPSSIIGGTIALLGGPEVWGRIFTAHPGGIPGQEVYDYCRALPGFLINIVFAALFLGKTIPPVREVWRRAGPQVAFGQAMAWGMYMVGLGITLLLLAPVYGVPPMFGTLLEIGFEGGHGTATGLRETFESVGWHEGTDLALGVATIGVVMGVLLGMLLINWAVRRGHTEFLKVDGYRSHESSSAKPTPAAESEIDQPAADSASIDKPEGEPAGAAGQRSDPIAPSKVPGRFDITTIEPVSLHIAVIGVAIGVGAILLRLLQFAEAQILGRMGVEPLMTHMPLFPLAMIGGILVQQALSRFLPQLNLRRSVYLQLQGVALDYLIVAALASLSLTAIAANWQPLLILVAVGIIWILAMFLVVGPRILPNYWFERGIADLGQSLGMTATGLLLLKIVDPANRSPALEAFGYKQLLFEPFVGGGLVTAMAVPLVFNYGPWPLLIFSTVLTVFWIGLGLKLFGRRQ